jgi:ATP-dependent RNA helicase DDX6/DHH1
MDNCHILVLDEADKLLSQDFKGMLDRVIHHLPKKRQVPLLVFTPSYMVSDPHSLHSDRDSAYCM